ACRAIAAAAWSSVDDLELLTICADMTWPLRPIVRASRTVPCSPRARAASGLCRFQPMAADHALRKAAASAAFEAGEAAVVEAVVARGWALVRGAGGSRTRFATGF